MNKITIDKSDLKTEEKVDKHGLQTSLSVASFLKTKIGVSIVDLIATMQREKRDQEFMLQRLKREEEIKMSFLKEEDEEQQVMNEMPPVTHPPVVQSEENEKNVKMQLGVLQEKLQEIESQINEKNELYDKYDKNIKEVDEIVNNIVGTDEEKIIILNNKIAALEGTQEERDAEASEIKQLVDDGKLVAAKEKINALNAKNLQIGTLKDMLSVVKGDKVMFNKDGVQVSSFKDADYVVPNDKKIVKEGQEYYLLGKNEKLSDENRARAKLDFERAKPEMSSVKNLISSNKELEMSPLRAKVDHIRNEIEKIQDAQVKSSGELSPMSDNATSHLTLKTAMSGPQESLPKSDTPDEDLNKRERNKPSF